MPVLQGYWSITVNAKEIAASIAGELRAYPERWRWHNTGFPGDPDDQPRCLLGLLEKRGARFNDDVLKVFSGYIPRLPAFGPPERKRAGAELATEIMIWNDQQKSVDSIISLCDRVAEVRNFAKEIEAAILKQTVSTEALSEELSF
jgi:hypothetical protein